MGHIRNQHIPLQAPIRVAERAVELGVVAAVAAVVTLHADIGGVGEPEAG